MSGFFAVVIVAIVFAFVYHIVKLSLEYSERIERIKHGYPLEDNEKSDVIDHRNNFANESN